MIRILIADDHEIVRKGLRQIVAESEGMGVTGEAASGQEALDLVRQQEFDVAIIDIAMPGRGGLDVLKDLRTARPALKVIILSMYAEEQYAVRSLRDGASAYLTKANATEELVAAIQAVAEGRKYITLIPLPKAASYRRGRAVPHEALSDREFQVLVLIGSGASLERHLAAAFPDVKTVSTSRTRILEKMGMISNAQLIRYAVEHNLAR